LAGVEVYPGAVARVIELLLTVHEETGDSRYLRRATEVAEEALPLFFGDSPLPRASTRVDHYESITGGPGLALALFELNESLTAADH
jgi:hypothetical protein